MSHHQRRFNTRVSHERWLVSYADFITLMFAFFVVMFSSARIDKAKMAQLTDAIQSGFQELGASAPAKTHSAANRSEELAKTPPPKTGLSALNHKPEDFAALQKELEKLLSPEIQRREVALRIEPDGLIISLREVGFFDSGSAQIKSQAMGAVHRVATFLKARDCALRIEGHTDNVPIHTASFASNWELSTARAVEVTKFLIANGMRPQVLAAAGYGEFDPVVANDSPEHRAQNRRIEIVLQPNLADLPSLDDAKPTP